MANRYRVYGNTTVTVVTEIIADSSEEALEIAANELCSLNAYCGNGGTDKLIGVDGEYDSVNADEEIVWDDCEDLGYEEEDEEVDEDDESEEIE